MTTVWPDWDQYAPKYGTAATSDVKWKLCLSMLNLQYDLDTCEELVAAIQFDPPEAVLPIIVRMRSL